MTAVHSHDVATSRTRNIRITADGATLTGDLVIPSQAFGVVLFAHGSGSSRLSPRNRRVAASLQDAGLATLLIDLMTAEEETLDAIAGNYRFDIPLLARRVSAATDWLRADPDTRELPIGYFGVGTGAAAALVAAAERGPEIVAVVSRGGRPDLARKHLARVRSRALLIVGEHDRAGLDMNITALRALQCPAVLEVVRGATHLFSEPGAIDNVAALANHWFSRYLGATAIGR